MERLILITWSLTVFTINAYGEGLSQYASPEVQAESSRIFRLAEEPQIFKSRAPGTKLNHAGIAKSHGPPSIIQNQSPGKYSLQQNVRPNAEIVYRKIYSSSNRPFQTRNNVNNYKKFRPSEEDPFLRSEAQEYLKKYAAQLYTAQRNIAQMSDYQKFIINQDPTIKNFVFSQTQNQSSKVSKYLPRDINVKKNIKVESITAATKTNKTATNEVLSANSPEKSRRKGNGENLISKKSLIKDVNLDNTGQSTAYKYIYEPEAQHHYETVFLTHVKDPIENFDDHALDDFRIGSTGGYENLKGTVYNKPPLSVNLQKSYSKLEERNKDHHPTKEPKYEFSYQVKDHDKTNNFGHSETRNGKTTWGKYYVQLSDGRFETVKYWADKTGYHAEVDFKGEAKHPPPQLKENSPHFAADHLKLYVNQHSAPYQLHNFAE